MYKILILLSQSFTDHRTTETNIPINLKCLGRIFINIFRCTKKGLFENYIFNGRNSFELWAFDLLVIMEKFYFYDMLILYTNRLLGLI